MSSSETSVASGATARVDLASPNSLLEITLVGPDFRPVASGAGRLETSVKPGIYQIVTRAGPTVERQLISLAPGQVHTARELSVTFPSSAPVAGTTTTHEYHEELASEATHRAQVIGATSWLAVMVRDVRGLDGPPLDPTVLSRLEILDQAMRPVANLAGGWELREQQAAAAWSGGLTPGPYLLRTHRHDGAVDQAIWLAAGWQTVVFLTMGPAGPEPASASVHMVDVALEWSPYEERVAEAAELASWALREGRSIVPDDLLDLLLNTKFRNPMFGLIGAHALLLQPTVDPEYLGTVLTNLGSMIPGHPDLVALQWMAEERRAQEASSAPVVPAGAVGLDWPPMLLASYQALLRMDAEDPGALRDGSVAERVAGSLTVQGIWTAWRPISPDAEEPVVEMAPAPPPPTVPPPTAPPPSPTGGAAPRRIGLPKLPWSDRAPPPPPSPSRRVEGVEWQPEIEIGDVLAGLAPSIEGLSRRRYTDRATERVARYLATVAELEGPEWAGARFAEITTSELALATQLPSATVDRSVRELRLLAVTQPPPPPRRPRERRRRRDDGGGGGGGVSFGRAFLLAIALLLLVGLGAVVGRAIIFPPDETPSPSPSQSATATPSATASSAPSATPSPAVPPPPTPPPPTPPLVGFPRVDPLELTFNGVVIGFESVQPVTVTNAGQGQLQVAPATVGGPAADEFGLIDGCAGVELAPGAECTIEVRFSPVVVGERIAELVVNTAGHQPVVVPLFGLGLPESPPSIVPLEFDFINGSAVDVVVTATGPILIRDVGLEGEFAASYTVNEEACEVTLAAAGIACVVTASSVGGFVSCSSVQPADLVFTTFGGVRHVVHLQTSVIC